MASPILRYFDSLVGCVIRSTKLIVCMSIVSGGRYCLGSDCFHSLLLLCLKVAKKKFCQCIWINSLIFYLLGFFFPDVSIVNSYFFFCFVLFLFLFYFFNFTILYWFCHISTWICHRYTCVPHPEPSSIPIPSLWVIPVHQPQASSIVHRTWTGDSFHIWYYTCFSAILPNHPTLSLSHRIQKTVLYISVSFAVSYIGLLLPSF